MTLGSRDSGSSHLILLSDHFPFWALCTCALIRRRCYPRLCPLLAELKKGATLACVVVAIGCVDPPDRASHGTQTPTITATTESPRVTNADYGESWPFTIDAGTLLCTVDGPRKYVRLDAGNGIEYALNGTARTFGFPDSKSIQKPDTYGVHLQPFIDRGLKLCR